MIRFESKGDFNNSLNYLNKLKNLSFNLDLDKYGQEGVKALQNATPVLTGLASKSWGYRIEHKNKTATLVWTNSDIEGGYNVAILLQYGHGTGRGTYVKGIDYINPALEPVFNKIAEDMWKEVANL